MADDTDSRSDDALLLSELAGRTVTAKDGHRLGQVADAIVRLDPGTAAYPQVIGIVIRVDRRDLFVPAEVVTAMAAQSVALSTARLDLRPFERRPGEVLLKRDLLGHRLIDVPAAQLVRARDVELRQRDGRWLLVGLDVSPTRPLARLFGGDRPRGCREWADFEPLIGHAASASLRAPFSRLRRLRPAQIADLVEDANQGESAEILEDVGTDKELEADVIEELEADHQVEVLKSRSDAEVADILSHMGPDAAADLLTDFPQERRLPVLDLLPAGARAKIRTLLGFNPATAGGMMTTDVLALASGTGVERAIECVRAATTLSPEVLLTVYVLEEGLLAGAVGLPALLQADPASTLLQIADRDPVRVFADADITEVAVHMTDQNLVNIPVVDPDDRLLGVITVDDVLEATVPEDWWDRAEDTAGPPRRRRRPSSPTSSLESPRGSGA
jgi:CBS domain-containing protein/sporulation protein YlmC with PRC-barrel domain